MISQELWECIDKNKNPKLENVLPEVYCCHLFSLRIPVLFQLDVFLRYGLTRTSGNEEWGECVWLVIADASPEWNLSANIGQEEERRQCCVLGAPCGRWAGFGSCTALKGGTGGNYMVWWLVGEKEPAPIRKVQRILFLLVKRICPCHWTDFLVLWNKFALERERQGGCCPHQTCHTSLSCGIRGLCK